DGVADDGDVCALEDRERRCAAVCPAVLPCGIAPVADQDACVAACTTLITEEQLACGEAAGEDCAALAACLGGVDLCENGGPGCPVPDPDRICGDLPAPPAGTCAVTPGSADLLIRGTLLGPEGLIVGGELLIDARGIIQCVDCDCSGAPGAVLATTLDCGQAVVSPGLINAHDHITFTQNPPGDWGDERYEHRHDWRRGARGHTRIPVAGNASGAQIAWGELRQIVGGTTSLVGSGGAAGFLRNLDANQEGLAQGDVQLDTFPLGDSGGELLSMGCDYPDLPAADVLAADAWSPHVSEGIDPEARNEFLCLSSDLGADVVGHNGALIHGVGLTAADGEVLASRGASVIWSPRSNVSLYGNTAPVTMLAHQGVLLGIGTDWTASGSINLPRELACADQLNREHFGHFFTDRELWLMATRNNAAALQVLDGVGSLAPGLAGDVAIYATAPGQDPYRAVIEATAGTTALVLRTGHAALRRRGPHGRRARWPGRLRGHRRGVRRRHGLRPAKSAAVSRS
ncbi:MAG: amidohydrolase family protein, partial [bacterium]